MKKILAILVFICASQAAFSIQEDKKISLDDAINIALKTNPQLQLAKLDADISKNNVLSAGRFQNPSLNFFQNIPKAGIGNPQTIGADYTIELLKRGKRKEVANANFLASFDRQKHYESILVAEVKKSYINFLVKKSHLKIIQEQEKLAKDLYNTMEKEVKEGTLNKSELIQAQIAYNRTIMYSNIARSEVIKAQNLFNSVMNTSNINYDTKEDALPEDFSVLKTVSPRDETDNFEKIKNYALSNRYDLMMAKREVLAAEKNLEVVKSQRIPDLSVLGGYAYQTKGMSDNGHFQSGGYVGASLVNIPVLYNFKPEIQNAEIEIQKAELKYKDLETDAIRNLTDAWEKFVIARKNLNLYNDEILKNSHELMRTSYENLNNKEIDITAFLVSRKFHLELVLGYQETLGEYYTSYAELLREMNADSLTPETL